MIVVIAPEKDIKDEFLILNQLFEAGLEFYHLRKPSKSYGDYCDYLDNIEAKYHNRIIVHHFHELINKYNLKGIHFQEKQRREHIDNPGHYFKNLNMFGKTISSSFHETVAIENCDFEFDYHFLSPVFSSISKQGYEGRGFDVNGIDERVIALGGIKQTNIAEIFALGYKGIAVLGSIWNEDDPVKAFNVLKAEFNRIREQAFKL